LQSYAPENALQNQLLGHFGLRENPFGVTPDPRFLFHSETHREALASLINGIDCEFGFQVLVAQPGMGKTTLLFNFMERFRATAFIAFLFQPQLEPHELLQSLLSELGAGSEETSVRKLSEQINQLLGRAAAERKRVIVVVDEAQNLDFAVLETLRQLSNFETTRVKLMQIILAGQPQLVKILAAPEQEQLRQRVSSIGRLSPLRLNETQNYINHRLRTAGYMGPELFTMGAVRNIWENAKGVPRNINTLCFNAMLLGFAGSKKSIDETILAEAARDLDMSSVLADMYRMELSLVVSPPDSKVQPIRETKSSETENAVPVNLAADHGSISPKTKIKLAIPPVSGGNIGGSENIPLALVEAIVRISQTLEEQKVLLAAKLTSTAAPPPVTFPAPAAGAPLGKLEQRPRNPESLGQTSQPMLFAPGSKGATPIRSDGLVGLNKGLPSRPETGIGSRQELATGKALQIGEINVEKSVLPEGPIVRRDNPGAQRPPGRVGSWMKALTLVAVTCILTIAVVEKSPRRNPAQTNAREPSWFTSEHSDSASRDSVLHGSSTSPMDAPIRRFQGTAINSHATREVGSDEFNDVTVRKFPVGPVVGLGTSTDVQDSKNIFFDQDSAVIAEQYRLALQQIADALAKDPEASAILEGHTDDSGPEAYNLDLSSRRAIAVREALINDFNVPSMQLTTIGSGSATPIQPNSSADGRAHNRRVAVRFVRLRE
jgi:type II secretory pathway predicted ATPase ExeA/outer membrane protein OmpA-like peptidoglycan-associated protein